MKLGRLSLLLALAAFAAAPAAAQRPAASAPAPSDNPDIVVTGNPDMEGQVRDFVGALTQAPPGGQIARFEEAVCPAAVGLPPAQKEEVAARLRRIAQTIGLRVGGPRCYVNLLVVVTPDKRAFIDALFRRYPAYFGELSGRDVRRLADLPGPAAAWQLEGQVTAEGVEMPRDSVSGTYVNQTGRPPSRIAAAARPLFRAAAVVVESRALAGLSTVQLADYAAMRTLARSDPARLPASSPPTILKILDTPMGGEVPITMTEWDLAFLRAFYASPDNLRAGARRGDISHRVQGQLQEGRQP